MAYNDFIKFATNHRNLLETAIKKYPTALKPSDLVEFDQVILESKKELRKEGLLEEWMPAVTFNCPEDYLYANAEEIFLESYLGPNYQNILIEQISGEIPVADINAAMKSQIEALKNLADWYFKLPLEQRLKLDRETVDSTKSRKTFMEELKDLESEINGIYGKLERPTSALGKMANWAKQKISGRLQRGVGTAFGAGEVAKTALEEQKIFEELFGNDQVNEQAPGISFPGYPNFQAAFDAGRVIAPRVRRGLTAAKKTFLMKQQAAQTAAAAAKTGGTAASGAGTAGTGTAAATGTQTAGAGAKGAAIAGKGAFAKLAAFAGAHPIGVAAGIGALVAAGAAGIKMRNRRKRIETLQAVARNAGAGGSVVTPPVESAAEKVAPPTGGTTTGGATTGGATTGGTTTGGTTTGGATTGGTTTGGTTTGGTTTGGTTTGGTPTGGTPTGGTPTGGATTGEAKKEVPAEKTADKKDIHIYSGSKGKGFQSRVAQKINSVPALKSKAGESQKAAAKVMRGLAADLKQANFNVLEEKSSKAPGRKEIGFSQTLAALDAVKDNTLRELLRIELLKTLRDEGLKVTSDSLKPGSSDRVTAVVVNVNADEPVKKITSKTDTEIASKQDSASPDLPTSNLTSTKNSAEAGSADVEKDLNYLSTLPSHKKEYEKAIDKNQKMTNDDNTTGSELKNAKDRAAMFFKALATKRALPKLVEPADIDALAKKIEKDMEKSKDTASVTKVKEEPKTVSAKVSEQPPTGEDRLDNKPIAINALRSNKPKNRQTERLIQAAKKIVQDYDTGNDSKKAQLAIAAKWPEAELKKYTGIDDFATKAKQAELYESLKRKYLLGLITLREYNIKKQKLDSLILREEIKRQVRSIIKK